MTEHDFGFRTDFYTFSPETLARELADYRIAREVGKGAMGIVYEAERCSDGQRVALKVLPPSLTLTDRALARFVKEGELMSKIHHPSIARVFDHGQKGRLHYFAMEFVDGTTLEDRVRVGPLPANDAADLCVQIADALQFAHDHGVVHRDVKPANLIVTPEGRVVITDFGLARETGSGSFTESGAIVGTPMYMAPEQILGHRSDVDTRADVYGLGATLFELLTGHPPFTGATAQAVLRKVLDQMPIRPVKLRCDLPETLEAITLRALAKHPGDRYGSALEMADDLRRFRAGERVLARLPSPATRVVRLARRHPLFSTLILLVVLLSAGALSLWMERQRQRINETMSRAELEFGKATRPRVSGFRPPTPAEKSAYLEHARRLATAVIDEDPSRARAFMIRAQVQRRQRRWRAALADFDQAAGLWDEPREDLLRLRIDTLQNLDDPALRPRLMADLTSLLRLDKSADTLCIVADYMLQLAAATPDPAQREDVLARIESLLDRIQEPGGPVAIARAELLQLRGSQEDAEAAVETACIDFAVDALVHDRAARIYSALGQPRKAADEASMAQLLRGEEASLHTPARVRKSQPDLDTESMRDWLSELSRLFGEDANRRTAPRK